MNPSGSKKTQLRKLMDRIIMESLSFEDFLQRMKAENVIIEQGKSKKYGVVTKYRFPDEERFHRGYSLGSFYTDDNIKKRIARRLSYLESQKKKAEARKEKKKAAYDAMTPGAKKLDKSRLKISSIQDVSGSISQDNIDYRNGRMYKMQDVCSRYKRSYMTGMAYAIQKYPDILKLSVQIQIIWMLR